MAELTVPQLDFSALGRLPAVYKQAQQDQLRQQTLSSLGPDRAANIAGLMGSGDMSLVGLGINLQNRQSDDTWRQQESARSQSNADRNYGLAVKASDRADEDKFAIKEVTDPNTGQTSLVRVKTTGGEGVIPTGITPSTPNNPFVTGAKLNTDQSKSATMVDRMNQANGVISKNENINDGPFGWLGGTAAAIPKVRDSAMFNVVATPERQQVIQAQRNFVNAILRVESGAAISQSEFDNAQRQYFPQPGDSKAVINQKRQNRVTAMQGMAREAGPNYKPPSEILPQNVVAVSEPQPSQAGVPPPPKMGELRGGYRFKGGNPGDPTSWAKAQDVADPSFTDRFDASFRGNGG